MQTILQDELDEEIRQGMYKSYPKSRCAWCNAKIPKNFARYSAKGNACDECMKRFNEVVNKDISKEAAIAYLNLRIADVKAFDL